MLLCFFNRYFRLKSHLQLVDYLVFMKNQTTKTLQGFSLRQWTFPLCLAILLSMLYLHYFENRAFVELDINVSQRTRVSFFWAKDGQEYSKWREVSVRVTPARQKYRFYVTDLREVKKLRIDTHDYRGEAVLNSLLIYQKGFQPLEFRAKKDFNLLKPLNHIESTTADGEGLRIQSTGDDPQLEFIPKLNVSTDDSRMVVEPVAAIFVVIFLFFFLTDKYREENKFVPLFLAITLALVLVMACITRKDVHPDEYVHLNAASYYKNHSLPPVVDDPSIYNTYSIYGVSRLNSYEVSYFFNGKLAKLLASLEMSDVLRLRVFNILLLGLLLLNILRHKNAAIMAVPLLISPQLWYIFSYCNSDAFSLFTSFLVAFQVALPDSLLNAYLSGKKRRTNWILVLIFGLLGSLSLLMKKNYLFFVIFILGYLLWRVVFLVEKEKRKDWLRKVSIIVLIGLCLAGVRIGTDYAVNGMDRSGKIAQIQEQLAKPAFKPSTPLEHKHSYLYRKARGDSLRKIITVDRWFEKTYRSAFGMYGYFTVIASDSYYQVVRQVAIALIGLLAAAIIFRGGISGNLLFGLFLSCSGTLVFASLYHSWTMDFQTQGRYLFPIIPMASIVLYHSRHLIMGAVFKLLVTSMFLLSVYSFIFVGLFQLPKI